MSTSSATVFVVRSEMNVNEITQKLSRDMQPGDLIGPVRVVYDNNGPTDEKLIVMSHSLYERAIAAGFGDEENTDIYIRTLRLQSDDYPDFEAGETVIIHVPLSREWSAKDVKVDLGRKLDEFVPFGIVPSKGVIVDVPTKQDGTNCGMATIKFPDTAIKADPSSIVYLKMMLNDTDWDFGEAYLSTRWHRPRPSRRGGRRGRNPPTNSNPTSPRSTPPPKTQSTQMAPPPSTKSSGKSGVWSSVPETVKMKPEDFPSLPTRPLAVSGTSVPQTPANQAPSNQLLTPQSISRHPPVETVLVAYSGQGQTPQNAPGFQTYPPQVPSHPIQYAPAPSQVPQYYRPQVQYIPPPQAQQSNQSIPQQPQYQPQPQYQQPPSVPQQAQPQYQQPQYQQPQYQQPPSVPQQAQPQYQQPQYQQPQGQTPGGTLVLKISLDDLLRGGYQ